MLVLSVVMFKRDTGLVYSADCGTGVKKKPKRTVFFLCEKKTHNLVFH